MDKIKIIQSKLKEFNIDGWLFYDFHNRDPIAYRILGLDPGKLATRRWYYLIPASGSPKKLVHSIESTKLDILSGEKYVYLPWNQQQAFLKEILTGIRTLAMQYSPLNSIPYISMVDAGTVELIKSFGIDVVSSADLVQIFEAYVSPEEYKNHKEVGEIIHSILNNSFLEIRQKINQRKKVTEYDIQQSIINSFKANKLTTDGDLPIVGVNKHSGDPHFDLTESNSSEIKEGDFVLIDLWAKKDIPEGIYFDITWTGYVGDKIPKKYLDTFEIVKNARDKGVEFIKERFKKGEDIFGYEVDDVVRNPIKLSGYGDYFIHRTGHSIGKDVHGNGANIDNLETKDERKLLPGSLFSIEPGIYFKEFGIRSEINVYISEEKEVIITGPKQEELIKI
ncbi:MAG: M24 family metallopeptidase [Acidobacteriota bacterium]